MRSEIRTQPVFSKILYSQCWEDPQLFDQALAITAQDDVLSITSGGCNTLALLLQNPKSLIAIDFNLTQNCVLELKIAAIKALEYHDFLGFLGVRPFSHRWALYQAMRYYLSDEARRYWDSHKELIERGVIHVGRFESYLRIFREKVLPLIHSHHTVRKLLSLQSLEEQKRFYDTVWDNRRWQLLFKIFFSRTVMGWLGRDPEFFKYAQIENVGEHYFQRAKHALTELPIHENYFVEFILTGTYANPHCMPPYMKEENFEFLKVNVDRVRIITGAVEEFLPTLPKSSLSKFNFSDIFEWMSVEHYEALLREIVRVSRDGARLCYWNNLVLREHPSCLDDVIQSHRELAQELHFRDRAFVYRNFVVESVHKES